MTTPLSYAELQKKYGIGLTGGIACGKSTVSKILKRKGFVVINADELSRTAVLPGSKGLAEVVEFFGGKVLKENGSLNRKKLSGIVFSDPTKRKKLESIIHPIVHELMIKEIKRAKLLSKPRLWFYEAALLYETGNDRYFKEIWAVFCSLEEQVSRLCKRDKISKEDAEQIISNQLSAAEKARRATLVIDTQSSIDQLEPKIDFALQNIIKTIRY